MDLNQMHKDARKSGRAWYIDPRSLCAYVDFYPPTPMSWGDVFRGPAIMGTREEASALGIDPEKYVIHWRTKIEDKDKI
jgi:hypothetical protein